MKLAIKKERTRGRPEKKKSHSTRVDEEELLREWNTEGFRLEKRRIRGGRMEIQ
jgi:hypothetical protein